MDVQLRIEGEHNKPESRIHDFRGIFPSKVLPTGQFYILERNGHLLFIKSYAGPVVVQGAHRRVFQRLLAPSTDSNSVQVWCVWGIGAQPRITWKYLRGQKPDKHDYNREQFRAELRQWWDDH